jgi:hypothetical protein
MIVRHSAGKTKLSKARELGIQQVGKYWLITTLVGNCIPMVDITIAEEES